MLGDNESVSADGVDHLVQVRYVVGADQEHTGSAGPLQWFENDGPELLGECLDLTVVPGDQRARADFLREELQIDLRPGLRKAVGVIHHNDAMPHCKPPELGG